MTIKITSRRQFIWVEPNMSQSNSFLIEISNFHKWWFWQLFWQRWFLRLGYFRVTCYSQLDFFLNITTFIKNRFLLKFYFATLFSLLSCFSSNLQTFEENFYFYKQSLCNKMFGRSGVFVYHVTSNSNLKQFFIWNLQLLYKVNS